MFAAHRYKQQAARTTAGIATSSGGGDHSEGDEIREKSNCRTEVRLVPVQATLERGTQQSPVAQLQIEIAEKNDAQAATITILSAKIEAQSVMIEAQAAKIKAQEAVMVEVKAAKIEELERNYAVVESEVLMVHSS